MSETGDGDRERSPLHEHRDFDCTEVTRDMFRPRVRRSGSSVTSVLAGKGPLVSRNICLFCQ